MQQTQEMSTDLDVQEQRAARDVVTAWLDAWYRQAWGTMAMHCQFPQSIGLSEVEICFQLEKRLGPSRLGPFVVGDVLRAHGDTVSSQRIAFADFEVVAVISGKRIGIRLRAVFDGKRWGVNFTSLNQRFDPDEG